ncbi:hypothetical protein N0V84_001883 [Fusarium piperis]|uniref:SnoaL-like domain-containing protein n=1 Tax=Fusarium piperis TaxID=1435070 RepID=A0A9W9BTU8_9HYPO|nr:hypothetical protein N0V84_001883 [Fusarium piperis]
MRASGLLTLCVSALAWVGATASYAPRPHARLPNCPSRPATPSQQRAILKQFVQAFYVERNATKALGNHVADDYIQHNPNVLSGRQNAIDALGPFLGAAAVNITVLRQAFDDNLAFIHYRVDAPGGEPSATVDIYRLDGTCIVEHWDVMQTRDPNSVNPLALF